MSVAVLQHTESEQNEEEEKFDMITQGLAFRGGLTFLRCGKGPGCFFFNLISFATFGLIKPLNKSIK